MQVCLLWEGQPGDLNPEPSGVLLSLEFLSDFIGVIVFSLQTSCVVQTFSCFISLFLHRNGHKTAVVNMLAGVTTP